jgi:hypothetical protein
MLLDVFGVHWSNERAADCMQQNLATLLPNTPYVTAGAIVPHEAT